MKLDRKDLLLYLVTDRSWLSGAALSDQVACAIDHGVTCIQLREKQLGDAEFLASAREIGAICRAKHVPFLVNDNVEVALASGADGVHVGQSDMAARDVRALLGPDKILGVSTQTITQAQAAEAAGADYLGVGAVFGTTTKQDAREVSPDTLRAICSSVRIPVVAIGGISQKNILSLAHSGIAGVSVISAILASDDIAQAARTMRTLAEQVI